MPSIMFQGTASNVGKSLIAAGICKVMTEDGYNVVPFKPQNMSLNSFIDEEGLEMGRAQVFQAEACKKKPRAYMNPVLLKPCGNHISQVIVNGKSVGNMSSKEYQKYKYDLIPVLDRVFKNLESSHDAVIIEGAGSPAEININSLDISNMKMAEIADAPVILVADIDRGGVFASIVGTLQLLKEEDRKRVKGVIINKFRGNKDYFKTGVKMLEEIIKIPVLGVVPYEEIKIEEEDGVSTKFLRRKYKYGNDTVNIEVIKLPHMSNFTDFEVFEHIPKTSIRYVQHNDSIGVADEYGNIINPDMIIIPGSKATVSDMSYLKKSDLYSQIIDFEKKGGIIIGICGGYQMLGDKISDEVGSDGNAGSENGFGYINMNTIFSENKKTVQVSGIFGDESGIFSDLSGYNIEGYELHMGRKDGKVENYGNNFEYEVVDGHILGTYCHGFFDNIHFTSNLLNNIRIKKGLDPIKINEDSFKSIKENEYNKLGRLIRKNLDINKIYSIIFE